jgi:hypothetical protein
MIFCFFSCVVHSQGNIFTSAWMVVRLIKSEKINLTAGYHTWGVEPDVPKVPSALATHSDNIAAWFCPAKCHHRGMTLRESQRKLACQSTRDAFRDGTIWKVVKHKSNTMAYEIYKESLDAATRLLPVGIWKAPIHYVHSRL